MALIEKRTVIHNEIDYNKLAQTINQSKTEIDYDKLAKAIISASKAEEHEAVIQREQTLRRFRKKYKIIKNTSRKKICVKIANTFRIIHGFLNYDEEQSDEPVVTFEMIKKVSALFFLGIEIILICLGYYLIFTSFSIFDLKERIADSFFGFSLVFFASIFRVIRIEVSVMKNKELINIVFSSIMSLLAVILAIIALF